jgi:hypothetical protein
MKEVVGVEARFLKMEVVGICEGLSGFGYWLLLQHLEKCAYVHTNQLQVVKNSGGSVRFIIVTYEHDGHELDLIWTLNFFQHATFQVLEQHWNWR